MNTKSFTRLVCGAVGALGALALAIPAQADTTLISGTGWIDDQVSAVNTPSDNSTISFTVGAGKTDLFSLSDCCVAGDIYQVTVNGSISTSSTFTVYPTNFPTGLGDTAYDALWTDNTQSHLQMSFGSGDYTMVIVDTSDPGPGYPAGFGYRLDAVPEPAAWALMIVGFGMAGYSLRRRHGLARAA